MIQRYQFLYGLIALAVFFSWRITKKQYGWIAFTLLSWAIISALTVSFYVPLTFDILSLRLRFVSAKSIVVIMMLTYLVASLSRYEFNRFVGLIELALVANSISYIIFGYGVFNAGSMDVAFMAMTYPMILLRPRPWTMWTAIACVVPLIPLGMHRPGSTGFIALALAFWSYFFLDMRKGMKSTLLIATSVASLILIPLGAFMNKGVFLSDSDRFGPWKQMMTWWYDNANFFTGTGTGSFQWIGPTIQSDKDTGIMVFLHNDILQILFEQGALGLLLTLALITVCLWQARKTPWLFACCIATLFVMTVQYPLRFLLSQIFILVLIRLCLDKENGVTDDR